MQGDALFGSTAPEIFVGRSGYPNVSTGLLSPVDREAAAEGFATSSDWYDAGLGIEDVLQRRTGMLNSTRQTAVDSVQRRSRRGRDTGTAYDVWEGFVGVQREVAIADRPVSIEVGLIVGGALFSLTGVAVGIAGPGVAVSFVLAFGIAVLVFVTVIPVLAFLAPDEEDATGIDEYAPSLLKGDAEEAVSDGGTAAGDGDGESDAGDAFDFSHAGGSDAADGDAAPEGGDRR